METLVPSPPPNPSDETSDVSGVSISGQSHVTARDIIGRDKIIYGGEYVGYTATQVSALLDKIRTEYQTKAFDGHSPYVGLAAFQERDADKFFGRETLTAELVTRVAACASSQARALFVAGPSGSGKSSLVRAGLIPALKKGSVPNSEHWLYETLKPGRAPLDELARVISSFANSPDAGADLRAHALEDVTRAQRWAEIALKDDAQRRAVIVIDQFEEVFTQLSAERENERVAFLNLLTYAATLENGRVLVLFTLRSDFVTNCASYPTLNALVNQQFLQVGAMTPPELVSAIARPALQVGLRLDPELVAQVVNDTRGEPGALPLMQFALQDLFEAEKSKGELTLDGYLARGGLRKALERHADAEFAKLDETEKQLARTVFSGLIEIGRGRGDTKRTARLHELVPAGADAARVQALVRELADARLITTDEREGQETVTLAHERLIDAWDWLRRLVDENRDAIALQNEIAQDAQEWETQTRDESYLYRGARLATAQEKLQQNKLVLNGLAQAFVETALAARDAERAARDAARQRELEQAQQLAAAQKQRAEEQISANKRLRQRALFLVAAFVLALLAIVAAGFFLVQSNANLQTARSRELAALAVNQLQIDPERALLIALRANEITRTLESENSLRQAISIAPITLRGHTDVVWSATFSPDGSPDGRKIVTASGDNTAKVWDATTGKELATLQGHTNPVNSATFSPDSTKIVTASYDHTAKVWDATTGKELATLRGHSDVVWSATFSPDGTKIVTASEDGTARVYLVHLKDLIALAKSRVPNPPPCQEIARFTGDTCPAITPVVTATVTP